MGLADKGVKIVGEVPKGLTKNYNATFGYGTLDKDTCSGTSDFNCRLC